ncbi:MAG TPA: AI-2E family transporter [Candidatus Paceibacterota bacterium]
MNTKKLQLYFFIGLLLAVVALTLALFQPFIAPIALAFMAAIVIRPVDQWFLRKLNGRRTWAAVASVLFAMVVILVPLAVLVQQITAESFNFYTDVRDGGVSGFGYITEYIVQPIQGVFPEFNPDIPGTVQSLADGLVSNASKIFSSTAGIALSLFVAIVALFYMLRDGAGFRKSIVELSPLSDKYDNDIIEKIERAVNSVVRGSLFTCLLQGTIATVGFLIFGVPHALLWGALTGVVALLPGIGTGLTIIPAVLFLLAQGSIGSAVGLAAWGIVAVGMVDNIIMPIVVGKGFTVHPLLVLLSVIGGLAFFGPVGLFLGPLVIALLSALIEIYKLIILDDSHKKETNI